MLAAACSRSRQDFGRSAWTFAFDPNSCEFGYESGAILISHRISGLDRRLLRSRHYVSYWTSVKLGDPHVGS